MRLKFINGIVILAIAFAASGQDITGANLKAGEFEVHSETGLIIFKLPDSKHRRHFFPNARIVYTDESVSFESFG